MLAHALPNVAKRMSRWHWLARLACFTQILYNHTESSKKALCHRLKPKQCHFSIFCFAGCLPWWLPPSAVPHWVPSSTVPHGVPHSALPHLPPPSSSSWWTLYISSNPCGQSFVHVSELMFTSKFCLEKIAYHAFQTKHISY